MEILVVGAGSLGSLVGGLLARDHDVTLVGAEAHVESVRNSGLSIEGEIRDRNHPNATTDPASASAELAIVAAKAYDTDRAAESLAECDVETVWSLQNGLGNEETLAEALDATVLAGTATYGAKQTAPGTVVCTGLGEVAIGPRPGSPTPDADLERARELGEAFAARDPDQLAVDDEDEPHRLQVIVDEAMPRRLWLKLAVNAGINPATALARVENRALAEGDVAETARRAARETARVAQATGIDLAESAAVEELEEVVEATADNESSMLQDLQRGRQTEVDAITGAVVERAEAHDVAVPTIRTLGSLVRAWERGRHLR